MLQNPGLLSDDYYMIRAVDFGINDPTAVLWFAVYPKANIIDVVAELYMKEATLDGVAHMIKEKEAELRLRKTIYSVGSPEMGNVQATSGQSINSMLAMRGVHVEKANVDRKAGWAKVRDMLSKAAIRVWPLAGAYGAPNLLRTLPLMQRQSGMNKDPNDIRGHQEDHVVDCLRYGVMAVYETPASVTPVSPAKVLDPEKQDIVFDKVVHELQKQRRGWTPELGYWD
jgi:hypothetical protein